MTHLDADDVKNASRANRHRRLGGHAERKASLCLSPAKACGTGEEKCRSKQSAG